MVMPGQFVVVLGSSDRLLDPIVADVSDTIGSVISVVSAVTVVPSVVLQLGVVTSLKEMSRCRATILDDEGGDDDSDSYEDYTGGILNPEISIGGGGGGRPYLRCTIATSALYAAILSLLMICYSWGSFVMSRWTVDKKAGDTANTAAIDNRPPHHALYGYPSALTAVAAFAMDGAIGAGTMLFVYSAGDGGPHSRRSDAFAVDVIVGFVAVLLCFVYIAHVLFVTTGARFPSLLRLAEYTTPATRNKRSTLDEPLLCVPRGSNSIEIGSLQVSFTSANSDFSLLDLNPPHRNSAVNTDNDGDVDDPLGLVGPPLGTQLRIRGNDHNSNSNAGISTRNHVCSGDNHSARVTPKHDVVAAGNPSSSIFLEKGRSAHQWLSEDTAAWEVAPDVSEDNPNPAGRSSSGGEGGISNEGSREEEEEAESTESAVSNKRAFSQRKQYASAWMQRYESYIEDSRVPWYFGLELLVAALVCVLGAIAFENTAYCVARGSMCALLCLVLLVVMVVLRPPFNRWRWFLMCVILSFQVLAAVLAAVNALMQDVVVELAMDVLGVMVSILLLIASAIDVAALLQSLHSRMIVVLAKARAAWAGLGETEERKGDDSHASDPIPSASAYGPLPQPLRHFHGTWDYSDALDLPSVELDTTVPPPPPLHNANSLGSLPATRRTHLEENNEEETVIRQILSDFRTYIAMEEVHLLAHEPKKKK